MHGLQKSAGHAAVSDWHATAANVTTTRATQICEACKENGHTHGKPLHGGLRMTDNVCGACA